MISFYDFDTSFFDANLYETERKTSLKRSILGAWDMVMGRKPGKFSVHQEPKSHKQPLRSSSPSSSVFVNSISKSPSPKPSSISQPPVDEIQSLFKPVIFKNNVAVASSNVAALIPTTLTNPASIVEVVPVSLSPMKSIPNIFTSNPIWQFSFVSLFALSRISSLLKTFESITICNSMKHSGILIKVPFVLEFPILDPVLIPQTQSMSSARALWSSPQSNQFSRVPLLSITQNSSARSENSTILSRILNKALLSRYSRLSQYVSDMVPFLRHTQNSSYSFGFSSPSTGIYLLVSLVYFIFSHFV